MEEIGGTYVPERAIPEEYPEYLPPLRNKVDDDQVIIAKTEEGTFEVVQDTTKKPDEEEKQVKPIVMKLDITTKDYDLLLAKVYCEWPGHENDAFTVYDSLLAQNNRDFRAYLGKGILLKKLGKKSDADRNLIVARYTAPRIIRGSIEAIVLRT